MSKITFIDNKLQVPNDPEIPFIEGDGIGHDICKPSLEFVDAAIKKAYKGAKEIKWKEVLAGGKAFEMTGTILPDETIEVFQKYLIGIKGPLTTPIGKGFRSINVQLRQKLDLFVCFRPVKYFEGIVSPVKHPEDVDLIIFRENTEDIYAGIEFMHGTEENDKFKAFLIDEMGVNTVRFPETVSFGVKPVSSEGSERLVRAAIKYAIENNKPSVTLVHKGNIMKFTEGAFKNWGYSLAEKEFPDQVFSMQQYARIVAEDGEEVANAKYEQALEKGKIIIKDVITDAFLQETLLHPKDYSVIATMNLNGDYVSDQIAAMVGGIGISPGANINYNTGHAIFEATHGTAPTIAGKGLANPSSFLLSAALLLEYIGWQEAADIMYESMKIAFKNKKVTSDLYSLMNEATKLSTEEFINELIKNIK